jgi:hypothetical protein
MGQFASNASFIALLGIKNRAEREEIVHVR